MIDKFIGLMKSEPAMLGTLVAAILPVAIVLGLDPKVGGSLATLITILAGLFIRASVWSPAAVSSKVAEAAAAALSAASPADVGVAGNITAAGDKIVSDVVSQVAPAS